MSGRATSLLGRTQSACTRKWPDAPHCAGSLPIAHMQVGRESFSKHLPWSLILSLNSFFPFLSPFKSSMYSTWRYSKSEAESSEPHLHCRKDWRHIPFAGEETWKAERTSNKSKLFTYQIVELEPLSQLLTQTLGSFQSYFKQISFSGKHQPLWSSQWLNKS